MTVSYWQDHSTRQTVECDVCVVGAGIVGLYLARLLAGRGKNTCILEARHVAAGASGRNAGMVLTGTAYYYNEALNVYGRELAHKIWELTRHNRDIVRGLSQELGTPWEQCGSMLVALDDTEAEDLQRASESMREDGLPAKFIPRDPTRRGFAAAMIQEDDGGIQPVRFAEALAGATGATLFEGTEVFAIGPLPGGGYEVRSRLLAVRCAQVALCTNAYAPLMHPYFEGKIMPARGQILCTEPLSVRLVDHLCYGNYGYEYFRQLPDGRFLLGGWRHHFRDMEVGYEDLTTPQIQSGLEGFMARYFPEAAAARITHRWSGTMGFSVDGLPLVGSLPDLPGVFFAAGFTGHGLGTGLATAERLAAHMLDGQDLEWLDARRLDTSPAPAPEPAT